MDDRLSTVCEEMRDEDILVYTITFQLRGSATKRLMENCASGPVRYFDSPSNAKLEVVFKAIGAELSNLRIGR